MVKRNKNHIEITDTWGRFLTLLFETDQIIPDIREAENLQELKEIVPQESGIPLTQMCKIKIYTYSVPLEEKFYRIDVYPLLEKTHSIEQRKYTFFIFKQ